MNSDNNEPDNNKRIELLSEQHGKAFGKLIECMERLRSRSLLTTSQEAFVLKNYAEARTKACDLPITSIAQIAKKNENAELAMLEALRLVAPLDPHLLKLLDDWTRVRNESCYTFNR